MSNYDRHLDRNEARIDEVIDECSDPCADCGIAAATQGPVCDECADARNAAIALPCLRCDQQECTGDDEYPATKQGIIAWLHEKRMAKVAKLLAVLPSPQTYEDREQLGDALETYGAAARKWLAAKANVRKPSDVTWKLLVDAVRKRKAGE